MLEKIGSVGLDHDYTIFQSALDLSYFYNFRETLRCTKCSFVHNLQGRNLIMFLKLSEISERTIKLTDLIKHSMTSEIKIGYCDICKSDTDHTSTTKMTQLPKVLILQLGRFINSHDNTSANRTPVQLSEEINLNFLKT